MRSVCWLAPGVLLSVVACGSVDRNALEAAGGGDAGQSTATDRGAALLPDVGAPATNTDSGNPAVPADADEPVMPPPVDAGVVMPPPVDAGVVMPPPVDAGGPPPPVDAGSCRACTAFAPVAFCAAPGMGACVPYAGCTAEGCATCASAVAGGDNCSDAIVISTTGQRRTVISTCGARNDLDTGCGRNGPDVVIALRVARRGRVVTRLTVPAGVSVNFGYDYPALACRNERTFRPCNNNATATSQGFDLTLDAGTIYLYVVTSVASTIVVETTLP